MCISIPQVKNIFKKRFYLVHPEGIQNTLMLWIASRIRAKRFNPF